MSFTTVSEQIKTLLDEFEVKDLPNLPNIAGIFEQSELTFAIVNGSVDGEYLNLSLNVSVACQLRFDAGDDSCLSYEERKNLDSIVFGVIYKLHRKKLTGCGLMRFQQFENFTPESGKWRSLLTFEVPLYLKYESLEQGC